MTRLRCKTIYPFITVEGYGQYLNGESADFPDNVAGSLLLTGDWQTVQSREEKLEPKDAIRQKKRTGGNV